MKLSNMTNKEAFKKIAKLIPVVKEISSDKVILDIWYRKLDLTLGATELDHRKEKTLYAICKMSDLLAYLLDNHTKNIYKLLAIMNDKTPKEIENQSFMETFEQLAEVLNDEALANLFTM